MAARVFLGAAWVFALALIHLPSARSQNNKKRGIDLTKRQAAAVTSVQNSFIRVSVAIANGDFGIFTTGGDPLVPSDDNANLLFGGVSNTQYATLRILDDQLGRPLTNQFRDMVIRHMGATANGPAPVAGGGGGGTGNMSTEQFNLVGPPTIAGANSIVTTFSAAPAATGGTPVLGSFLVVRTITIIRNQAEIKYAITNLNPSPRRAGLRMMFDTELIFDDGIPFFFNPLGRITTEREFIGNDVPADFFSIRDIDNPTGALGQGILSGSAATKPDKIQFASWPLIVTVLFDYQVTPNLDFTNDSAYALYWNPIPFGPGGTRTFVTYYGLGFASGDYNAPLVLTTRSPLLLSTRPGPDPTDPLSTQLVHLQPSEFTITGSVFNPTSLNFPSASLSLTLPTGLELMTGETLGKSLPLIRPSQDLSATWRVRANGLAAGALTYSVNASVPLQGSKSVTRTVGVPALPQDIPLGTDVQMVTFPYTFPNNSPDQIFVSQLTNRLIPSAELKLATFDPRANEYLRFPTDITALLPGVGYWMKSQQGAIRLRLGDAVNNPPRAVSTNGPFPVQLSAGWNMVGDPFLLPVSVGQLEVSARGQRLSFSDAGLRQLIRPILFNFQRGRGNISADYVAISDPLDQMVPRLGYWIRALDDVQLVVNPPQFINQTQSRILRPSSVNATHDNDWRLRLVATAGEGGDFATAGVSARGSDAYDALDTEKPPSFGEAVRVHFSHGDWGRNSGRYALDLRQPFVGRKSWDAEVETNLHADGVVTATWPALDRLSRNLRFVLTDLSTNRVVSMRLEPGYTFQAPAGPAVRHLRIAVETGGASGSLRLQVQPVTAQGGNVIVPFSATESGVVSCVVLSLSGKTVSVVANDSPMSAGLNSVRWSRKNQQGLALPRGVYLIRLTAKSDSGGQAQAVKSIQIK